MATPVQKKMSVSDQRRLVKLIPDENMRMLQMACCHHCDTCKPGEEMKGAGFKKFMKKAGKTLWPIGKELGMTVLKELVVPYIKQRIQQRLQQQQGQGLKLAGMGLGLSGMGARPKRRSSRIKKKQPRKTMFY